MKQLSGLDAGFLYMENGTTFGHVSSMAIYDEPTTRGQKPYDIVRARLEQRLPIFESLRRRLVEVPFQLDHPWWIEDPDFDLDFHVRHIAVPPPGKERELADLIGRIISRPLDRSRPLWEAYVIEGLAKRQFALVIKMHHATIDGAAGAMMMSMMLDTAPDAPAPSMPELPPSEDVPTHVEMMGKTMVNFAHRPQRMFAAQGRIVKDAFNIAKDNGDELRAAWTKEFQLPLSSESREAALTRLAPPTPFNKAITAHRRFAYRSFPLSDVKLVEDHFGVTLNNVVMAACGGVLRRYLDQHEALPDKPLIAAVPVSIRSGDEEDIWTNRVASVFSQLPTHIADPAERVRFTHDSMAAAKGSFNLVPAESLIDLAEFAPPAVFTEVSAVVTRMRVADRMQQVSNLVISNSPGPRQALYMSSARLLHYYPVSTVAEGQGLNITVQTLEDKLDVGLVACRELVPDLWHLIDDFEAELAELVEAASDASADKA
jgi:diacylglycerol O-acyltransferase